MSNVRDEFVEEFWRMVDFELTPQQQRCIRMCFNKTVPEATKSSKVYRGAQKRLRKAAEKNEKFQSLMHQIVEDK